MPEVLGNPPSPRTALFWNGTEWQWALVDAAGNLQIDVVTTVMDAAAATAANQATMITALQLIDDLRNALDSVGTDELDVNVEASVLPAGAATAANQALLLAQLQLIEDLRDALQSVATDRLIVRGEDQLISFKGVLGDRFSGAPSGADGYVSSTPVGAGLIWKVTTVAVRDITSPLTGVHMYNRHDAVNYNFMWETRAIAIGEWATWGGETWLDVDDVIRVYLPGCLAGDTIELNVTGHIMTLET